MNILQLRRDPISFFGDDPKAVYHKCAAKLHPDVSEEDSTLFKELQRIYESLTATKVTVGKYELQFKLGNNGLCDIWRSGDHVVFVSTSNTSIAREMMAKEREITASLQEKGIDTHYGAYFPEFIDSFVDGKKRINVLPWNPNVYTAEEIKLTHPEGLGGRHIAWMFKRLLVGIGYAHNLGWVNCAILPNTTCFETHNHGAIIGGWIYAMKAGKPLKFVQNDYVDWYPAEAKRKATQATDIYLAARLCDYLMDRDEVPNRIKAFLTSCKLPSSMATHDAWKLHEEFTDCLHGVYGAPKFVPLEMEI